MKSPAGNATTQLEIFGGRKGQMQMRINGFGRKKQTSCFRAADLRETAEELSNPARGWYQIHTFLAEQEPDFEELRWCLHPKDTLAFLLIDIGYFRNQDLDQEVLERLCRIFAFFSERSYDCIVRVVYDHEGKALIREPLHFFQVKSHLEQIGSVLRQFSECIFVFQGMLVGNWGEMHSSRFLEQNCLRQMAEILRIGKGEETYLAVRRPVYWRILHEEQRGKRTVCAEDMGLFDDAILASETHLGTFGTESRKQAGWNSPWKREEELAFETEIGKCAPNGGEAVYGQVYLQELTPSKVLVCLRKMQITYLNRVHDARMLEVWKEWQYPGTGVWKGKSVYDYIGAHMGYRFLIRNVYITRRNTYQVDIEIENVGFASYYQEAEIYLEFTGGKGECISKVLEGQMKRWKSGELRKLTCTIEAGAGALFLSGRRKRDGAAIWFGNVSDEQGRVLLGDLLN